MSATGLFTVIVTGSEVFVFPDVSRATAVSVTEPLGDAVVCTVTRYGATVTSGPIAAPFQ